MSIYDMSSLGTRKPQTRRDELMRDGSRDPRTPISHVRYPSRILTGPARSARGRETGRATRERVNEGTHRIHVRKKKCKSQTCAATPRAAAGSTCEPSAERDRERKRDGAPGHTCQQYTVTLGRIKKKREKKKRIYRLPCSDSATPTV